MSGSKARSILICTAIVVAFPALAQVQPSAMAGIARTVATTRIDQPATLTSSQDLAFVLQSPVAAALNLAQVTSSSARRVASAAAAVGSTATVGNSSGPTGTSSAPNGAALLQGGSSAISAAVPTIARATFTVAGDSGQAISVTVPPTVELAREGGIETARLTTTNNLADGPQFLGGDFAAGGTMSFAVGGQVTLASNTTVSTGTYNGLLAVVAQYN